MPIFLLKIFRFSHYTLMFSTKVIIRAFSNSARCMVGDPGSGAGKGGGSGGSIRDAGGAYGKMEAAREDEYFHKLKMAQLKTLKQELIRESEHHADEAKHHQDVVERHKKRIEELEEELNNK